MNCPNCGNELDAFDIDMELCSHCNFNFDPDELEDNDDAEMWNKIDRESINGFDIDDIL